MIVARHGEPPRITQEEIKVEFRIASKSDLDDAERRISHMGIIVKIEAKCLCDRITHLIIKSTQRSTPIPLPDWQYDYLIDGHARLEKALAELEIANQAYTDLLVQGYQV